MAPIPSDDESNDYASSASEAGAEEPAVQADGLSDAVLEDDEEEFHTEDSEGSEDGIAEEFDGDDASGIEVGAAPTGVPLLPESLLKQLPKTAQPAPSLMHLPWDQLNRKQKKARRRNNREMKKQTYDRLNAEAKATGVLEAGKAAQKKRGVVPAVKKDKVRSGRVEKKAREKVQVSGRQQIIEQRKREVDAAARDWRGNAKRARTGSKR